MRNKPVVIVCLAIVLATSVFQTVFAQAPQTVDQIGEFPAREVITDSAGHSTSMSLQAVVNPRADPAEIVYGNPVKIDDQNNKLISDRHETVTFETKQHLQPLTARFRDLDNDERLRTVIFHDGLGDFSLRNIEKPGIYVLDVMVRAEQSGYIGIYETFLFKGKNVQNDPLKVHQLADSLTEPMMLRFSNVNMTKVLQ